MASTIIKKGDFGCLMLQKIEQIESRRKAKLSLAQKILLAETGTVEQVLSILTGTEISVKVLTQKEHSQIIRRESVIISKDTGKVLIHAYSKIFLSCLPPKARIQIKDGRAGIGSIIYNLRLETFRKILEIGYDLGNRSVFRRYQIRYKNKIAFEIKEEVLLE